MIEMILFFIIFTYVRADTFMYMGSDGTGAFVSYSGNPLALHYIKIYIQERCGLSPYKGKIYDCGEVYFGAGICRYESDEYHPSWRVNATSVNGTCFSHDNAVCASKVVADQVCSYYLFSDARRVTGMILIGILMLAIIFFIIYCVFRRKKNHFYIESPDIELNP